MAAGILMPKAGITVESCIIGKWEKKKGDRVGVGEVLFTYETDKAVFECESTAAGEILEIFYAEGDEVPVLTNVCAVGEPGEDIFALRPGEDSGGPPERQPSEAAEAQTAYLTPEAPELLSAAPEEASNGPAPGPMKVSPRARELAQRAGADVGGARGTGPYGRVIERDVRELIKNADLSRPEKTDVLQPAPGSDAPYEEIRLSGVRRSIASAMTASLSEAAQLTHFHSFDAGAITALRKAVKDKGGAAGLPDITLNDIILFAVSRTLPNHPDLNAHLQGHTLRRFRPVHLGIAVDTPRGLLVPTLFDADKKSLSDISREAKSLIGQAQSGTISPDLLRNGTFTVTNLGSLGVEMFTPILNPPQTGILGVCGIVSRMREKNGVRELYPAMGLSLTYDHRAVDGAPAARFMQELIFNLENISLLLIRQCN